MQHSSVDNKSEATFSAALLKVASRCNLNCDYCYVYKHADQSWRDQPVFMSKQVVHTFGKRLNDYIELKSLDTFSIIFHGGEPLLYTAERLIRAAEIIRASVRSSCTLQFSLQTNGVLLTNESLLELERANISISLSLDGPRKANDLHRLDHAGDSSYEATLAALQCLLSLHSSIFQGVIAVIDPVIPARELFEFFHPMKLPRLDLLLPDATYVCPPPGRTNDLTLYQRWLENAFEIWFHEYSDIPIRWFDAVLASRLGVPSPTDVMGMGTVNLIVIETDGSYTDHDVFKITQAERASLQHTLYSASFEEISHHSRIKEHGYKLTLSGLASECKTCPVVEACGGGCVMHRYHPTRGFDAPTVYCREMYNLQAVATRLLRQSLDIAHIDIVDISQTQTDCSVGNVLVERCRRWRALTETRANEIASKNQVSRNNISAAAIILRDVSMQSGSADHLLGSFPDEHKWLNAIHLQSREPWLALPFLDTIRVLLPDSPKLQHAISILPTTQAYIAAFNPFLLNAISELISDIMFVESTLGSESGIFSFSDDTAPNVLFIAPYVGDIPLTADDLADSIIHEFLHQVLYHMERDGTMLFDHVFPRFPAPWRVGLRPSGGFLHGTFVFSILSQYWLALAHSNILDLDHEKAHRNAIKYRKQAVYGLTSLKEFAVLTRRGSNLVNDLASQLGITLQPGIAPGILTNTET